jgi:hypothetical protein
MKKQAINRWLELLTKQQVVKTVPWVDWSSYPNLDLQLLS